MKACNVITLSGDVEYCIEVDGILYPFNEEIRDMLMVEADDASIKAGFLGVPKKMFSNIEYKEKNVLH